MIIALDVYYKDDTAKAVGVIFNKDAELPVSTAETYLHDIGEYIPGEFYKRELPCLLQVLKQVDLNQIDLIIIDGYVYVDDDLKPGLGFKLWEAIGKKIPVIGVAKTSFATNKSTIVEVLRGTSNNPLYISVVGYDLSKAAELIKGMPGKYRVPDILTVLDRQTKDNWG